MTNTDKDAVDPCTDENCSLCLGPCEVSGNSGDYNRGYAAGYAKALEEFRAARVKKA